MIIQDEKTYIEELENETHFSKSQNSSSLIMEKIKTHGKKVAQFMKEREFLDL